VSGNGRERIIRGKGTGLPAGLVHDMAAEIALAAAALTFVTDTPGRWDTFVAFAAQLGGPGAHDEGVLTREYGVGCAADLARLASSVMRTLTEGP
jgi:hypothetical protein